MHILIEGTKWESVWQVDSGSTYKEIPYKLVVNHRDIKLFSKENVWWVNYSDKEDGFLTITKDKFDELMRILGKLNCDEAYLLNELALEKACKNGTKDLEDIKNLWSKEDVNAMLGLDV